MLRTLNRRRIREEERRILGTLRGLKVGDRIPWRFPLVGSPWRAKASVAWCVPFLPLFLLNWGLSRILNWVGVVGTMIDGKEGRAYWSKGGDE